MTYDELNLKPWERGDLVLQQYEMICIDPTMTYMKDENKENIVRVIADLLHYCSYQNACVCSGAEGYIDIERILPAAQGLYNSEPPAKDRFDHHWLTKDLIPFVLTDDPHKMTEFQLKFFINQNQAVDDLIENSCWGEEELPDLVGNKGTPAQRLTALRRALRAAGE